MDNSIKKKYDSKKYNDTFRKKHEEQLKEKIECPECKSKYTYYTKSKHLKTKKHLRSIQPSELKAIDNAVNYVI